MSIDLEIAQANKPLNIEEVAARLGLSRADIDLYGDYKAKLKYSSIAKLQEQPIRGKLVLVTAIHPTPAGEGKTTTSVGLADGFAALGKKACLALREPSLGPCFGIKGGAAGGGYAQLQPMEDINLHFTGDFHAIAAANNLLSALIDNHLQQGNALGIDPRRISWRRVVDMNDRALRQLLIGMGGPTQGVPREEQFDIAVASEIMAILCLSASLSELKERLGNIIIGKSYSREDIYARDLKAQGAMAALLKDAIRPNIVQSLEGNPAFVHGGPFANIAHGCNSLLATSLALRLADYVVTEAGFAADLGAEKFFDIKCRVGNLQPSAVVLVATVRALKMHGGQAKEALSENNPEAVLAGTNNLRRHIENLQHFGLPLVVAINHFVGDSEKELAALRQGLSALDIPIVLARGWAKGGEGMKELAQAVVEACERKSNFEFLYSAEASIEEKIERIAKQIYGASGLAWDAKALRQAKAFAKAGYGHLPICMAKTQYSFSHDAKLGATPEKGSFELPVRDLRLFAGAGFIVAYTGDIMTMPGLPKVPAAEQIDIDDAGNIQGLF